MAGQLLSVSLLGYCMALSGRTPPTAPPACKENEMSLCQSEASASVLLAQEESQRETRGQEAKGNIVSETLLLETLLLSSC